MTRREKEDEEKMKEDEEEERTRERKTRREEKKSARKKLPERVIGISQKSKRIDPITSNPREFGKFKRKNSNPPRPGMTECTKTSPSV